ncbi:septum site-determining protein MinC [Pelotomaculum terephthalicicum JT]|uniref:septum site-determining protein MinC n=1 Tax=Pelotomaculum TaxID=191373 RepID=UPI0009C72B08|nr:MULTISPECIES: septum site-determining protein MinC [Pelotomaculum]MCG9967735.1 septum site-determining protein MinC [Pelotomaculum terephthalicicum JT]OPX85353.1 MAG: Septum site-determining protein MinC [Pelotomaculum sp. PtaB.Bin117]OPY62714.1 MAG: Septum site-determining protein MinC [Pelotomaculum sp. PtaU1.Bin065]
MNQDTVRIKGTRNGLVIVLDSSCDFEDIKENLLRKMESARGFFKGAKFSLFQNQKDIPADQKNELVSICRQYGLVPNTDEYMGIKTDLEPAPKTYTNAGSGEAALLVRRSLRSGQKISSPEHVVVFGDVHPGAEIVSGGNVLVMGCCRGVIHAGAGGDRKAKVIARQLTPTIISIADRRYSPGHDGKLPPGRQLARFNGKEIVFEVYLKHEMLSSMTIN